MPVLSPKGDRWRLDLVAVLRGGGGECLGGRPGDEMAKTTAAELDCEIADDLFRGSYDETEAPGILCSTRRTRGRQGILRWHREAAGPSQAATAVATVAASRVSWWPGHGGSPGVVAERRRSRGGMVEGR